MITRGFVFGALLASFFAVATTYGVEGQRSSKLFIVSRKDSSAVAKDFSKFFFLEAERRNEYLRNLVEQGVETQLLANVLGKFGQEVLLKDTSLPKPKTDSCIEDVAEVVKRLELMVPSRRLFGGLAKQYLLDRDLFFTQPFLRYEIGIGVVEYLKTLKTKQSTRILLDLRYQIFLSRVESGSRGSLGSEFSGLSLLNKFDEALSERKNTKMPRVLSAGVSYCGYSLGVLASLWREFSIRQE